MRGNVYMVVGAGGNTTIQFGDEGVMVVDTQFAPLSDKLLAAIRSVTDQPIRYVVNTHMHGDHIGGNEAIAKAGRTRAGGNVVGDIGAAATATARIIAHENALNRLSVDRPAGQRRCRPRHWPTETFFNEQGEMLFNGEAVQIIHQPAAHTDGDIVVFFRTSDVVSTGDLFTTVMYPFIDDANGGTINGYIKALNAIIDITVPSNVNEGGTMVVPGHGRLSRRAGRDRVSRHGDDRPRSDPRVREARHDARPGEGEEADARFRSALRQRHRLLDDVDVHRDDLQADGRRESAAGEGQPAQSEQANQGERGMRRQGARARRCDEVRRCERGAKVRAACRGCWRLSALAASCRHAVRSGRGGRGGRPRLRPGAGAPVDLTGTWVSVVTEDWEWRMRTPAKGDTTSVPLNAEGRKVADRWEPSMDGRCEAYGVGGVMRMPRPSARSAGRTTSR